MVRKATMVVLMLAVVAFAAIWLMRPNEKIEITGTPIVAVSIPTLTVNEQEGKSAFESNCAACHGLNAAGNDGAGPPLVHRVYEPNHHGDAAFHIAARNGVRQHHWKFGNMPPVEGVSSPEMQNIVVYVRRLQQANGVF